MVQKQRCNLKLINDSGEVIYEVTHRRSKTIKIFVETALLNKWVAKDDIFWIIKNTEQSKNIWEYLELKRKLKTEDDLDENEKTNDSL